MIEEGFKSETQRLDALSVSNGQPSRYRGERLCMVGESCYRKNGVLARMEDLPKKGGSKEKKSKKPQQPGYM